MDTRVQTPPRWRPDQQTPAFSSADKAVSFAEQLFGCTECCSVADGDVYPWINMRQFGLDEIGQDGEDWDDLFHDSAQPESEEHYSKLLGNSGLRGMNNKSEGRTQKADIREELKSLAQSTGDLFAAQGWDIVQVSGDHFAVNGRKVRIFLLPKGTPLKDYSLHSRRFGPPIAQRAAHIMVHDGPLKQPLLDYLMQTGLNEHYDARGTENPVAVTGEARKIEFAVPATALDAAISNDSRMDAMKHATAQATVRRKSATDERGCLNLFADGREYAGVRCTADENLDLHAAASPPRFGSLLSGIVGGAGQTLMLPDSSIHRGRSPNMNRPIAGSAERSAIDPRLGSSREPSLNRLVAGVPVQYTRSREPVNTSRESSLHCRIGHGSSSGSQSPRPPANRAVYVA